MLPLSYNNIYDRNIFQFLPYIDILNSQEQILHLILVKIHQGRVILVLQDIQIFYHVFISKQYGWKLIKLNHFDWFVLKKMMDPAFIKTTVIKVVHISFRAYCVHMARRRKPQNI